MVKTLALVLIGIVFAEMARRPGSRPAPVPVNRAWPPRIGRWKQRGAAIPSLVPKAQRIDPQITQINADFREAALNLR